jgi:nicotinate dehydrogenase subunit B
MEPDQESRETESSFRITRREFLKLTGSGLLVFFTAGELPFFSDEVEGKPLPSDFNAFLKIGGDGRVSCFTGKIEMGQGVITSLAQELADELDVPLESVKMVMGDTDLCPWDMGTFGSRTTRFFGPPLRAAAAEARAVLLELASKRLHVPVGNLTVKDGEAFEKARPLNRVTYAQLTRGKRIERHLSGPVKVKDPSDLKIMHRPELRRDALEKVTGKARYAGDIHLTGMLYARILRPPAHGARLVSADLSEAEKVEGVRVVRDKDMIAVLHPQPDIAEAALRKIKAAFEKPKSQVDDKTIFEHLLQVAPPGNVLKSDGDLRTGKRESKASFDATYLNSYVAHAPIEPHTATVRLEGNRATVWPSSQTPFRAKEEAAQALGIPSENVRVISPFVGGGFGGKTRNLQVEEAARLARLTGRPVQVAWSRNEEFFYDSFRPAAVVKIRSGTAESGDIRFWDYHVYFAGDGGAVQFYHIPHHRTVSSGDWRGAPGPHPFATGAWRAPANNTNTFARESQIDIMAAQAKMDPLAFRLQNLADEKMRCVLKAAAEKFGWKKSQAPSGQGHGIACGTDSGTYVATVAEVEVDKSSGAVSVKRVVSAQDMGLSINPEGASIQMEGCITMGMGYALTEEIHFNGGEILDRNFDTYEIPRFSWLPKIETVVLDNPKSPPQGGGEPAIITMGAVLANAIFDACGARIFQLPMTPDRVKEALEKASGP